MQNNSQVFVDPDEDEVFFGCVTEREKSIIAKLAKHAVPGSTDDCKLNKALDECVVNVDENLEEILGNEQSIKSKKEVVLVEPTDSPQPNKISNTSVELEHNYSTPMKHKIDKSILATPKSIVKADKDGGFLKVLSEIALVKAEAEGDSNSESKKEDEDKENKAVPPIPEIKVTEATPEKGVTVPSPSNVISTELRRFRIIYHSPRKENNISHNPKSIIESFENERNLKNKLLDQEIQPSGRKNKSINLIDFSDSSFQVEKEEKKNSDVKEKPDCDVITLTDSPESEEKKVVKKDINPQPPVRFSKEARKIVEVLKKSTVDDTLNFTIPEIDVEEEENSFLSPKISSTFDETIVANDKPSVVQTPKLVSPKVTTEQSVHKTEEKRTPFVSQRKLQPVKFFSERRVHNEIVLESRSCVKKLPLEDKRPATVEKVNGVSRPPLPSRIPVFGAKNSKIPLFERVARPGGGIKMTPSKTSSAKSLKYSKFNHIESPIKAYINNKPTAVCNINVRPEVKKEGVTKAWKIQTLGSAKKVAEKPSKEPNGNNAAAAAAKLPQTTPYKITSNV